MSKTEQISTIISAISTLRKAGINAGIYPLYGDRHVSYVIPVPSVSLDKEDVQNINYALKESIT